MSLLMGSELQAFTASNFALLQPSLVAVEGGTFMMGDSALHKVTRATQHRSGDHFLLLIPLPDITWTERKTYHRHSDAHPVHKVTVDSYLMGKNPVTNQEYGRLVDSLGKRRFALLADDAKTGLPKLVALGSSAGEFDKISRQDLSAGLPAWTKLTPVKMTPISLWKEFIHPDHPVVKIGWRQSVAYAFLQGARLAFEAEYEWAARGPNLREYATRSGQLKKDEAWYDEVWYGCFYDSGVTIAVNDPRIISMENGLRHLCGNVWEWCMDRYGPYSSDSAINPTGPISGEDRVLRGGSYDMNKAARLRATVRKYKYPDDRYGDNVGLRLVASPGTS